MVTIKHTPNFKKNQFEKAAWTEGQLIAGIDEVGRGCLAGPVVTAAVILPPFKVRSFLKDSKLTTHEERIQAAQWIEKHCLIGIGIVDHRTIDSRNIYQATLVGMKRAVMNLMAIAPQKPQAFLVDAMPLSLKDSPFDDIVTVHHFIYGETKSSSIAAASIIAKITRDRLMGLLDYHFPQYGLAQHKGYSTLTHKKAVHEHGTSIIHRTSFTDHLTQEDDSNNQQALW